MPIALTAKQQHLNENEEVPPKQPNFNMMEKNTPIATSPQKK
jgi:hypothetical protein